MERKELLLFILEISFQQRKFYMIGSHILVGHWYMYVENSFPYSRCWYRVLPFSLKTLHITNFIYGKNFCKNLGLRQETGLWLKVDVFGLVNYSIFQNAAVKNCLLQSDLIREFMQGKFETRKSIS